MLVILDNAVIGYIGLLGYFTETHRRKQILFNGKPKG